MIQRLVAQLLAALLLAGVFGAIAGCNTVAGVGEDLKQGGQKLKEEAREKR